jgi:hypothetical protein
MDERIETLWGQLDNLTNKLANRGGPKGVNEPSLGKLCLSRLGSFNI